MTAIALPLPPQVDIVVPVFDEQATLAASIRRLHAYLTDEFPFSARITIADNASTDATLALAWELARELPGVRVIHLDRKGRGRALRQAWTESDAAVVAYMDVDLSTGLAALAPLVAPLLSGHSHVAIGSRLAGSAAVARGPKRELISRCYNLLLRTALRVRFSDAQCGFKAVRGDVARVLLPVVEDNAWFFDTELLVVAERAGLRIHEVPVDWVDDPDSRVAIVDTAVKDLLGVGRLARDLAMGRLPLDDLRLTFGTGLPAGSGQVGRFAVVGIACTLGYVAIFAEVRQMMAAQAANVLALLATAVANTAANRRWTFGRRGPRHRLRHHLSGLLAFGLALAVTSLSLAVFHAGDPRPTRAAEVAVLVAANLVATAMRFVVLRSAIVGAVTAPTGGKRLPAPAAGAAPAAVSTTVTAAPVPCGSIPARQGPGTAS